MLRGKGLVLIALAIVGGIIASGVRPVFAVGDFLIGANPNPVGPVQAGTTGVSNITVTNRDTSVNTIALVSNNTLICSLSNSSVDIRPSASNSSILSCTSSTVAMFAVNVTGTSGTFTHTVTVIFNFKILVNLDGNSISQTDVTIQPASSNAKSFRIGAMISASTALPVNNVFGWEFQINYNATAFVPQGDPDPLSLYPDGAAGAALFGAQTTTGTANWAAQLSLGHGFTIVTNTTVGSVGQESVAFTLLNTGPVNLSAKTLLANVNFELLNEPTTPQVFTITNVIFSDQNSNPILAVTAGAGVTETIINTPPTARFTVTPLPKGDASCVPITGSNCSAYAFKFDGTASSDPENVTIVSPSGFFWDFGDLTQDLATQGSVAIHDYGAQRQFTATLRVQDGLGATGSSRDSLGNVVTNSQPSHTSLIVVAANGFLLAASPAFLSLGPTSSGVIGTSTITLTSVAPQFTGTIALSAASNPSGPSPPTFSFSPPQVRLKVGGSNTSILTVSAGSTTPRVDYNITVTGAFGQLLNNVTIILIPTTISVQPGVVTGVTSGGSFNVNVNVSAANLFSWQFQLNYQPAILSANVLSVTFGSFWSTAYANHQAILIDQVNQTRGTILLAGTLYGTVQPPHFTGNGTLATITFKVVSNGDSGLILSNAFLVNNVGLGQSLPLSQKNGVFCNISCFLHDASVTKLTVNPSTATIGASINITATVTNLGLNPDNVTVTFFSGSTAIATRVVFLTPGNTTTVTVQWNTANLAPGALTIMAQTSLTGSTDGNTANDASSAPLTLASSTPPPPPPPPIPLLYIIVGVAGAIVAVSAAIVILRRRRGSIPEPEPGSNPGKG